MPDDGTTHSDNQEAASADLWRAATIQVRDTVKYIVGGFAAVGAIMVGTAPLAGVGKVSGGWAWLAFAGGTLAVGGVLGAVWKASDVLLPNVVTLNEVRDAQAESELARFRDVVIGGDEGLFRLWGGGGINEFRDRRDLEYATLDSLDEQAPADAAGKKDLAATRATQVAVIEQVNSAAVVALAGAQYASTKGLARSSRKGIALAAVAVAGGVALFSVAVNREDSKSAVPESAVAAPASISLTAAGTADFAKLLGSSCVQPASALILSGDSGGPWEVVTTGGGGCQPARFELTPAQGEPVYVGAVSVHVTLTQPGKNRLGKVLGGKCVLKSFGALDLGDVDNRVELLTLKSQICQAVRFTLTPKEGTVSR